MNSVANTMDNDSAERMKVSLVRFHLAYVRTTRPNHTPSSNHSSSADLQARQQTPSLNLLTVMFVPVPETFPSLPPSPFLPAPQMSPPFRRPPPASLVHQPTFPPFPLPSVTRTIEGARQCQPVTNLLT